jgi:hypothetical protein
MFGTDERLDEDAPAVHSAQAKLHNDRRGGDSPTVCETICGHGNSPFLSNDDRADQSINQPASMRSQTRA